MTPYEQHKQTGHPMSRFSPNGIDVIEECDVCGMRWIWHAFAKYPITMRPRPVGVSREVSYGIK